MADGQPDPVAAGLVDSILGHPGLQTQEGPDGSEVPANDQTGTEYLKSFVPGGQPAAQPTQQAALAPEPIQSAPAPQPTGGRLYAGKYRSVEELESAAQEKDRVIREREAELRGTRAVVQHLEEVYAPLRAPRETPRPQPVPVTLDDKNQPVVDPQAFMNIIDQRAQEMARKTVEDTLRPMSALNNANQRLRSSYPEVGQRESEFAGWLAANPEMQQRVVSDPENSLELAYLRFERDHRASTVSANTQAATTAQAQVNQARANASPAGGNGAVSRRPSESEGIAQRLNALYEEAVQTNRPEAWKRYKNARVELAMGGDFLNALERTTWGR